MNKFNEILNSSDASDALLGEQIDKINAPWEKKIITDATARTYFGTDAVTCYYNAFLKKVILVLDGTTIKEIAANSAFGIGNVATNQIPLAWVYVKATYNQNDVFLVKNSDNQTIALSNKSATAVPVGTAFKAQLEYTVM